MHSTSLVSKTTLLVVLLVSLSKCAIISQSSISDCSWGDDSEPTAPGGVACKKKMLVSMVLGSAQGNTESLHANIDRAHEEGRDEMSVLKKPFRIELRKTAVVVSYRAYLVGTANALPKETSIKKKNCIDDFYANPKKLPCGMQYDKMQRRVWDSQGFCCTCDSFEASYNKRGGHSCNLGNAIQFRGSAHCMKMNDLWYDIFTLEMPMMQYKITLDVLELQDITVDNKTKTQTVNWTPISTFHLSPSKTLGRSKTGRVIAEIQGSLLGSRSIKDFSTKMLLIPSVRMWPKDKPYPAAYTNGPKDWMLVDKSMVQLLGTECNKVGVQYTGFRRQHGRCQTEAGFCFHNQPLQLWQFDNEKRKEKKSGRYMIHNYGTVHQESHPNNDSFILKFLHNDLHNSFVTLRIDATDISFVRSVSSGRIVETYTVPFTATVGHGALTVEVGNTGEVSSDYSVSVVKCDSGLYDMAARSLSLEPGEVKNTTFTLRSGDIDGGGKECEVQLFDSTFNLIDVARVNIKVGAACLCFGICGCVCEDEKMGAMDCSKPGPPTVYKPGPIALTLFVMVLESIGAHGFIGFFGGLLLILGFIKLSFGGVICCRKTKAQKHTQKLIEKGVPPKSPLLVQCSGECRGAKAAIARYQRKVNRLRAAGKSPHRLDDWRNTSFECHCKTELADVQMIHVVRTVCFFYFCCILPFIWIGRFLVWRIFRDTEANKAKAEQEVLKKAKKKGNLEKYGIIDLAAELKKFEEKTEGSAKDKKNESEVKDEKNDETEKLGEEKKEEKDAVTQPLVTDTLTLSGNEPKKKDRAAKTDLTKTKKDSKNKKEEKGKKNNKQSKTKHQKKESVNFPGDNFEYDEQCEREAGRKQQKKLKDEERLDTKQQTQSPRQKMKSPRDTLRHSPQIKQSQNTRKKEGAQSQTIKKKEAAQSPQTMKKEAPQSQHKKKEVVQSPNTKKKKEGAQSPHLKKEGAQSPHTKKEGAQSPHMKKDPAQSLQTKKKDPAQSLQTKKKEPAQSPQIKKKEAPQSPQTRKSDIAQKETGSNTEEKNFRASKQKENKGRKSAAKESEHVKKSKIGGGSSKAEGQQEDTEDPLSHSGKEPGSQTTQAAVKSDSSLHDNSNSGNNTMPPDSASHISHTISSQSHSSGSIQAPSHAASISETLIPSQHGSSHSSQSSHSSLQLPLRRSEATPSHATSCSGSDLLNPSQSGSQSSHSSSSHSTTLLSLHSSHHTSSSSSHDSSSDSRTSSHSTDKSSKSTNSSTSSNSSNTSSSHSSNSSSSSSSGSSSSSSSGSTSSHSDSTTTAVTSESSSHHSSSSSTSQLSHSDNESNTEDNSTSRDSSSDASGSGSQGSFESEQSSHSTISYVRDSGSRSLSG